MVIVFLTLQQKGGIVFSGTIVSCSHFGLSIWWSVVEIFLLCGTRALNICL